MSREARKTRYIQAFALHGAGRYAEALLILEELHRELPQNNDLAYARALCLAETGRDQEAREAFERLANEQGDERARQVLLRLAQMEPPPQVSPAVPEPKAKVTEILPETVIVTSKPQIQEPAFSFVPEEPAPPPPIPEPAEPKRAEPPILNTPPPATVPSQENPSAIRRHLPFVAGGIILLVCGLLAGWFIFGSNTNLPPDVAQVRVMPKAELPAQTPPKPKPEPVPVPEPPKPEPVPVPEPPKPEPVPVSEPPKPEPVPVPEPPKPEPVPAPEPPKPEPAPVPEPPKPEPVPVPEPPKPEPPQVPAAPVWPSLNAYPVTGFYEPSGDGLIEVALYAAPVWPDHALPVEKSGNNLGALVAGNWDAVADLATFAAGMAAKEGGTAPDGASYKNMAHTVVLPREGVELSGEFMAKRVSRFQPGTITTISAAVERAGAPTHSEVWGSTDSLGLNGQVQWWGTVGLAGDATATITHVLIRAFPKE